MIGRTLKTKSIRNKNKGIVNDTQTIKPMIRSENG
jgi:hypothetical protein